MPSNIQSNKISHIRDEEAEILIQFVIEILIQDFFDDSIYKYYFLPEKLKGIKTNYNYVKSYLEKLMVTV